MSFILSHRKKYRDSHKQSVKRYHELVRDKNERFRKKDDVLIILYSTKPYLIVNGFANNFNYYRSK